MTVAAFYLPLVVPVDREFADEPHDSEIIRNDADDIGTSIDFGVDSLEWNGRSDLRSMRLEEINPFFPTINSSESVS